MTNQKLSNQEITSLIPATPTMDYERWIKCNYDTPSFNSIKEREMFYLKYAILNYAVGSKDNFVYVRTNLYSLKSNLNYFSILKIFRSV